MSVTLLPIGSYLYGYVSGEVSEARLLSLDAGGRLSVLYTTCSLRCCRRHTSWGICLVLELFFSSIFLKFLHRYIFGTTKYEDFSFLL